MKSIQKLALAVAAISVSTSAFSYAIGTPLDNQSIFSRSNLSADMEQCVSHFATHADDIVRKHLHVSELDSINLESLERNAEDPRLVEMDFNVKVKVRGLLFFPRYETTNYHLSLMAPRAGCLGYSEILSIVPQ